MDNLQDIADHLRIDQFNFRILNKLLITNQFNNMERLGTIKE
jgi:hypothetical protein